MSAAEAAVAWRALVTAASDPYQRAGRFAWHFARGKLRWDPVFCHLVARGLIAPRTRVLDIGCGQGLLASLVAAAARAARQGRWPSDWAEAPVDVRVSGIELLARDVARARDALGDGTDIVCADMRTTAFSAVDIVVLLDVLHYVSVAEQDAVLARVRAALPIGGRLVLRVGDAAARRGFAASRWVDRIVTLLRGQGIGRQAGRTLAAWQARLAELGFAVASEPMRDGTPFANVLLVAVVEREPASPEQSP
ncbi:MAG TPA: class I SAM-dependent methyltransferase [Caldimonas sp.]|jgi:SAM-dependent methyltransferase|nr:class I SAM-dependent methyltransferase [Caldimonas sp.]